MSKIKKPMYNNFIRNIIPPYDKFTMQQMRYWFKIYDNLHPKCRKYFKDDIRKGSEIQMCIDRVCNHVDWDVERWSRK